MLQMLIILLGHAAPVNLLESVLSEGLQELLIHRNSDCIISINISSTQSKLDLGLASFQFDQTVSGHSLETASRLCSTFIIQSGSITELTSFYRTHSTRLSKPDITGIIIYDSWIDRNNVGLFLKSVDTSSKVFPFLLLVPKDEDLVKFIVYRKLFCSENSFEVDIFSNGAFIKHGRNILSDTNPLNNLSCMSLKVATFQYEPFVTITENEGVIEYGGFEYTLFSEVAKNLRLSFSISPPSDGGLWGVEKTPGNFTGLVGDVQHGKADIGFADFFMVPNRKAFIDYTTAYDFEYVCFMVSKPLPYPQWMSMVQSFTPIMWVAVSVTCIIATSLVFVYGKYHPHAEFSSADYVFFLCGIFVDESQPHLKKLRTNGIMVFFTTFLVSFELITNIFRTGLTSSLAVKIEPSPIDTLEELVEHPAPVASFGDTFLRSIEQSIDPTLLRLATKYQVHFDFAGTIEKTAQGMLVMGEGGQFLQYTIRKKFTNGFGETSMHLLKECLIPYQVAFALQKGSIYTDRFGEVIKKFQEGGFIKKWTKDEMEKVAKLVPESQTKVEASPWTFNQLQGPFYLFGLCCCLSIVCFGIELYGHHRKNNNVI